MRKSVALMKAFWLGIKDGWSQPYCISTSYNVDHLADAAGEDDVYNWQDRGINVGQVLRAGLRSEAWTLRYWPFGWLKGKS